MEANETQPVTECLDQRMSRGEKPERHVDFKEIESAVVYDEKGNEINFGEIYRHQKTIIILIRNFLCFMTKEYIDDLALIPECNLKNADVKVVVVGCGPYKFIADFKNVTGYKYEMYSDPERVIFKKLQCKDRVQLGQKSNSKHVKSGFLMGIMKSAWRGMKFREYQGDLDQQGGSFIFGPGNQMSYSHVDLAPGDHARINDLLRAAGVEEVQFANDNPVINI